jgi:glutathione-specific gamma-glutamylcyclotransferase
VTAAGASEYDPAMSSPFQLTREFLLDESIRGRIKQLDPDLKLIPIETHREAIHELLEERAVKDGVWVFGYGSLIWNPLINYQERRIAKIHGYHRRFCLWTKLGRGSPECPGLLLGLDRGGACRGVAYRIAEGEMANELEMLWRREMVTNAYDPRWVKAVTREGPVKAIAFLVNRNYPRYAGAVPEDEMARAIATAAGTVGDCASYLFNTVTHLEQLGIRDPRLERLRDRVVAIRRDNGGTT